MKPLFSVLKRTVSSRLTRRDGSFEYPQHMFWLRNKNNNKIQRGSWPADSRSQLVWIHAFYTKSISISHLMIARHIGLATSIHSCSDSFPAGDDHCHLPIDDICKQFKPKSASSKHPACSRSKRYKLLKMLLIKFVDDNIKQFIHLQCTNEPWHVISNNVAFWQV